MSNSKKNHHIKKCEELYSEIGPSAVYEYATKHNLTDYRYCNGCESEVPTVDGCCLLCGSACEPKESNSPLSFSVEQSNDSNFPGLRILVNGELIAMVEHNVMKNQIRTIAYKIYDEEPEIIVFKQL